MAHDLWLLDRPWPAAAGQRVAGRAAAGTASTVSTGYEAQFEPAMSLALAEATEAARSAGPDGADVPVGAVVLDAAGAVVARARNRREADQDPTAHAEILAIRDASRALGRWRLTGCTLVVTLEPCTMCAGAITVARLGRLVYGAEDPRAGAVGSLWDVVRDPRLTHRPEVLGGVLAGDCAALLRDFFLTRRRPDRALSGPWIRSPATARGRVKADQGGDRAFGRAKVG